jgi:hypothetical protein
MNISQTDGQKPVLLLFCCFRPCLVSTEFPNAFPEIYLQAVDKILLALHVRVGNNPLTPLRTFGFIKEQNS